MMRFRSLLGLCLALLVTVTSQQLAIARGQPHAAGQVELCVGSEVIVISVDENGNPTGPAHICPDVAIAFLVPVALPDLDLAPVVHISKALFVAQTAQQSSLVHIDAQARGPPVFV